MIHPDKARQGHDDTTQGSVPAGHLRIRVDAVALSALDIEVSEGRWDALVMAGGRDGPTGYEIAGVVDAVGGGGGGSSSSSASSSSASSSDHASLSVGQEVVCVCPLDAVHGGGLSASGFTVQPVEYCARKPRNVTFAQAAACLTPGLRAYAVLFEKFRIRRGDTLLVCRGASAFGHMALQLAEAVGARTFCTAR